FGDGISTYEQNPNHLYTDPGTYTWGVVAMADGDVVMGGTGNTLGGLAPGAGNVIAYNGGNGGIRVLAGSSGNAVLSNSIFSNDSLGISLDAGANHDQAAPSLNSVAVSNGSADISGSLQSAANTNFRIQLFGNGSCDP